MSKITAVLTRLKVRDLSTIVLGPLPVTAGERDHPFSLQSLRRSHRRSLQYRLATAGSMSTMVTKPEADALRAAGVPDSYESATRMAS